MGINVKLLNVHDLVQYMGILYKIFRLPEIKEKLLMHVFKRYCSIRQSKGNVHCRRSFCPEVDLLDEVK